MSGSTNGGTAGRQIPNLAVKRQQEIALEMDKLVVHWLKEGSISRGSWWAQQRNRRWLLVATLVTIAALSSVYQLLILKGRDGTNLPSAAQLATALVAAVVSVFAYQQWGDHRREESLSRFYERLGAVNSRYCEWDSARDVVPHFWALRREPNGYQKMMYVYMELDNLEYILTRYRLGYVSDDLLKRAIRTFASRCESRIFQNMANLQVTGAGYVDETRDVVKLISKNTTTTVPDPAESDQNPAHALGIPDGQAGG